METLSRLEAQILAYLLERLPISTRGRCWVSPLAGGGAEVIAAAPLAAVPGTSAVFTLARASRRVVLTLTGADPVRVGPILARAAHEAPADADVHVLALDDPYLAGHGRAGVALLPPGSGRWFPGVPDAVRFDAEVVQVSMATFLSPSELADARTRGPEPLLAAFARGERDLIRFGSRERAG
ncbi:hypothetical protein [Anaeromyxobacter oryzae]|uniref:Suppressor of fused-like domain-containing protein n=1 Tax=Anaeromyxobacter oryzae TaxID=2918170 RepID=A0ABM7X105_9BACT|nr:hypothetical protein [Anaeromyxobacter oryzae]BDG05445.1 hypothetical protein AMOR_44410 [Anaeromyxobacter oryzae]